MPDPTAPALDLPALLAAKAFTEDDLAHNRRGVLSPAQDVWRAAHPKFVDDEGPGAPVEAIVGRVTIEGRYVEGQMGETRFAALALPGRRFSLRPGLDRCLVRDAPYRAYVAHGWVWSIEPATEADLAGGVVETYRSASRAASVADIARALHESLSGELEFEDEDLAANRAGRFSPAQRAQGRRKLVFGVVRLAVSVLMLGGLLWLLADGAPFPVFATISGVVALGVSCLTSAWAAIDGLARVVSVRPRCVVARLGDDPTNRDRLVLETEGEAIKIPRAAVTIAEAPLSDVRTWRFELYLLPWTRAVLAVRGVPPSGESR